MRYSLAVEEIESNHWGAWAVQLWACYHSARTQEAAIAGANAGISDYFAWRAAHGIAHPLASEPIESEVVEVVHCYRAVSEPDYEVNAFFADDARPLTQADVDEVAVLFASTRRDLLAVVQDLPDERLNAVFAEGQRFATIADILNHVARAEWWYFDRLNLALERGKTQGGPLRRVQMVREHSLKTLPSMVGDTRIVERTEEKWSTRKILRRALWHERDHTQHIRGLLNN